MSTDDLTITEQLELAHESVRQWRRAHGRQLQHTVAARAQTKAAERKAQLLQAKLDGTAMAGETVMGGLCSDMMILLGEWCGAAELNEYDNNLVLACDQEALRGLWKRTKRLLSTPRVPK